VPKCIDGKARGIAAATPGDFFTPARQGLRGEKMRRNGYGLLVACCWLFAANSSTLLTTSCFGAWILPTSNSDPNSKWTNETRAYDANMTLYCQGAITSTAGSYLNLFHAGVTDCNKIRLYFYQATVPYTVVIDVNYGADWHTVYSGVPSSEWITGEIGSLQTVVGMRLEAYGGSSNVRIYEAHFWQASTGPPTKIISLTPADADVNKPLVTTITWAIGGLLDTDSYKIYLGTDTPPTSILNGTSQGLSETTSAESYNPQGLPPADVYYWRIDAVNDNDVNAGDIRSFETRDGYKYFLP
jgi:hypothetical protein